MKPQVVITHWVHPEAIQLLSEQCEVIPNTTRQTLPREEVLRRAKHAQAIMVFMPDMIDESFLLACPELKIVSAALKGYDNFDVAACTQRGIWFAIVKDALTIPTADLAFGLLIGLTRRVLEGDRFLRSGNFQGWQPHLYGTGLAGRTLGLIGLGAVGQAVAKRTAGFDLNVIYYDVSPLPKEKEEALGLRYSPLDELLQQSDFVLPLLPLTPQTFHLINSTTLGQMRRGSFLVNVGRGSVVDEQAVADALVSGHLAGYAADVFEMEDWARADRPSHVHLALLKNTDRTLFTPHLGSAVDDVRREVALEAARYILQAGQGRKPEGAINSVTPSQWLNQ